MLIQDLMSPRSTFRNVKIDLKTIRFQKLMKNAFLSEIDTGTIQTQSDMPVTSKTATVTVKNQKIITDFGIKSQKKVHQVKNNNNGHFIEHIFSYGDVEVINSTVQELLGSEETKVVADLVTLLPVKSNSEKIRNWFADKNNNSSSRLFNATIATIATTKYIDNTEIVTSISSELKYFSIPKRQHKIIDSSLNNYVKYLHTNHAAINSSGNFFQTWLLYCNKKVYDTPLNLSVTKNFFF